MRRAVLLEMLGIRVPYAAPGRLEGAEKIAGENPTDTRSLPGLPADSDGASDSCVVFLFHFLGLDKDAFIGNHT